MKREREMIMAFTVDFTGLNSVRNINDLFTTSPFLNIKLHMTLNYQTFRNMMKNTTIKHVHNRNPMDQNLPKCYVDFYSIKR
jgi:ASC-1-like (ASCH) protein